ncbi:hypothetical protein DW802_01955 [Ruminococcus bromii]|jgi:hypothetical protein|nr:hypothetical protein [Ruminococcus bromii]RHD24294.1 hypothetical protein DW802_01955 [Ruminococcus bromii]
MSAYKLMKLLKDKKVADAYQYFEACSYKLYLAELSYSALEKVIAQYQANEKSVVEKVFEDAYNTGKGTYKTHKNSVDYFGTEVSPTVMMDKLTMEIMSLLHNFFDIFAQWLNACLFAEDCVPMERLSLTKVASKLPEFSEYTGQFIADVSALPTAIDYLYIADFNNTLKHRRQIYVENKFDIFSIQGSVCVPEFSKDGRPHVKEDALTVLRNKMNYCTTLLDSSKAYVEEYYAHADNLHVIHRYYNPMTYLFFESKEDFESMRSPKNHYYYIEVDPSSILDEYHFLLCCDRMDGSQDESIEFFNSPYQIIMLREIGTQNIVGILKPVDGENRSIKDERELSYRKYSAVLTGFEHEMFVSICSEDTFHYYPCLSDMTGGYMLHDGEPEQDITNEHPINKEQLE